MIKKLKEKTWFKIASNRYVLATSFFIIWMLFLDNNSTMIHRELNQEISTLEEGIEYYSQEVEKNKDQIEALTSDPYKLEKFARETYWMHKPGEEIFLIVPEKE